MDRYSQHGAPASAPLTMRPVVPRFVILRHDPSPGTTRPLHWDLMLEDGPTLRTWALDRQPAAAVEVAADMLADHRKIYLDYEGPVSKNRGTVSRWEWGEFCWLRRDPQQVQVSLRGQQLVGTLLLSMRSDLNTVDQPAASSQRWTVSFSPDESGAC